MYYAVEELIKKVDFNKLWPGFEPLKFALYNENECFFDGEFVNKTDEFLANTAIKYNGEMIAIWKLTEEINPVILCSKIIHEMYHGYQNINGESRFPDEFEAIVNYKCIFIKSL